MASLLEEDILEKDFKILTCLGCSSFVEVMLAKHLPTYTQVTVKALQKAYNTVADIRSEVTIHKSLKYYHIIQFFYVINTLNTMYVVMEYLEGKDLERVIREVHSLKEKETRPIFSQLPSAVHFLHQRRIAHCDIKLENILLGEGGKVKLCNFEFATQIIDNQMLQDLWGSLPYWASEILARKPYDGLAGDMWSLGVVLYAKVTGHFPYEESIIEAMYHHITNIMCPSPNHLTKPCYIILARLLTVYVWFRLTSSLLVKRPWLAHTEEHITPPDKEILHKVLELMCNIGYTCKQVVSSLKHLLSNNLTATMNIIKFKLSSGGSSLQNIIPAVASSLFDTMKRRHSESTLLIRCRSNARLHIYSCPEVMHYSDNMVPEKYSMTINTINPAAGDNTFSMISVDSLSDKKSLRRRFIDHQHHQPHYRGQCILCEFSGYSVKKVAEDSLTTNTINPSTSDNAFKVNAVDSLYGNFSAPEPPLNGKCIGFVFLTEEETILRARHSQEAAPGCTHSFWNQTTLGLEADKQANFPCTESTVLLLPAHPTWVNGSGLGEFQSWYGVPAAQGSQDRSSDCCGPITQGNRPLHPYSSYRF